MDRLGGLDILIHNVGGSAAPGGGALALSDDDWQQAFDTNPFAAVQLDRAFLPSMLKQRSGVIIHRIPGIRTGPLQSPEASMSSMVEQFRRSDEVEEFKRIILMQRRCA